MPRCEVKCESTVRFVLVAWAALPIKMGEWGFRIITGIIAGYQVLTFFCAKRSLLLFSLELFHFFQYHTSDEDFFLIQQQWAAWKICSWEATPPDRTKAMSKPKTRKPGRRRSRRCPPSSRPPAPPRHRHPSRRWPDGATPNRSSRIG